MGQDLGWVWTFSCFSCFHLYDMIANYGISYSSLLNIGISVLSNERNIVIVYSYQSAHDVARSCRNPDAGNLERKGKERKGPILREASLVFGLIINIQGSSDY
jgi:hypothetical protein